MCSLLAHVDWSKIEKLVILDGFLLYHVFSIHASLQIKLFLRTSTETSRKRRFGRYGDSSAPEESKEFWNSASYFEKCAWPNFVENHAFFFPSVDIETYVDSADVEQR